MIVTSQYSFGTETAGSIRRSEAIEGLDPAPADAVEIFHYGGFFFFAEVANVPPSVFWQKVRDACGKHEVGAELIGKYFSDRSKPTPLIPMKN